MPKLGYFTPSRFADAMTNGRGKDTFGKTALTLVTEVAMERIGVKKEEITAPALTWGNDHEPIAIMRYMEITFSEVEPVLEPFVHPEFNYVAGTPDGLIGVDGLIEVKCPFNPVNHFLNLSTGEQIAQYNPQMQGYMWITGAKWCDFVSFDPRFPDEYQIKIIKVDRDQQYIDALAERIAMLNDLTNDLVKQFKDMV